MVEYPFGTIKRGMGMSYFLCKGLEAVRAEMSLTVLAYNLKRVLNILGLKELMKSGRGAGIKERAQALFEVYPGL